MKKKTLNIPTGVVKGSPEERELKKEKSRSREEVIEDYLKVLEQLRKR